MKRFRMHKQKVVKPDGRWMYLYTFEEEPSNEESDFAAESENPSTVTDEQPGTEAG